MARKTLIVFRRDTTANWNDIVLAEGEPGYDKTLKVTKTGDGATAFQSLPSGGGVTDHGALTGLLDNDHTQYLLKEAQSSDGDVRNCVTTGIYQIGPSDSNNPNAGYPGTLLAMVAPAAFSNTYAGWAKYAVVTITNSPAVASYQVRIELAYDASMNADFSDIRFTDNDDTALNYWIESYVASTSAVVWVEVVLASTATFRIFIGNASATSESNGVNVFEFFDDFPGTELDTTTNWTIVSGTPTVSGGILSLSTADIKTKALAGPGYCMMARASFTRTTVTIFGTADYASSPYYARFLTDIDFADHYEAQIGTSNTDLGTGYEGYHIWEVSRIASNNIKWFIDRGAAVKTTTSSLSVNLAVRCNGGTATFDWVALRKCLATEPTTSVGSYSNNEGGDVLAQILHSQRAGGYYYMQYATYVTDHWVWSGFSRLITSSNIDDVVSGAKRSIILRAAQGWPSTTAGCAALAKTEFATNKQNITTLDFDTTTREHAEWVEVMPDNYDGGTIVAQFYWTAASGSGTVSFALQGRAYTDSDAIDQAWGSAQQGYDTLITANDVHVSPETTAITLGGSPVGGQLVQFRVFRNVVNDTLGVDAKLIAVKIKYGIDAVSE